MPSLFLEAFEFGRGREKECFFVGGREMLTEDFLFLVISVAQVTQLGIGRDVWTLTPENIEKALKVSE